MEDNYAKNGYGFIKTITVTKDKLERLFWWFNLDYIRIFKNYTNISTKITKDEIDSLEGLVYYGDWHTHKDEDNKRYFYLQKCNLAPLWENNPNKIIDTFDLTSEFSLEELGVI